MSRHPFTRRHRVIKAIPPSLMTSDPPGGITACRSEGAKSMVRTSHAMTPGHITRLSGSAGTTEALHRLLFDTCEAIRILGRFPGGDERRSSAIDSGHVRAAMLATSFRESGERWIKAATEDVLTKTPSLWMP